MPTTNDPAPAPYRPRRRERTLERRLFGWVMGLTLIPALALLAAGGWALGTSLDMAGGLGPWEEVALTGRAVFELAEPDTAPAGARPDSALAGALETHRQALSESLTQARRWAFLAQRFLDILPWLTLVVAAALLAVAAVASRVLARQFARPIRELVMVAERLGREEPLPPSTTRSVREIRVLDHTLRDAAAKLGEARERALATERLRVWGEMARRVAHEMKNPLTPLRIAAHRLGRLEGDPGVAEAVEVIREEVRRLEELAGQFSALGRPPEGPASEVDVRELLQSLLETDVPGGVAASLDAEPGLPPVLGHYDALFRAFRNLIRNALDATESVTDPRIHVTLRLADGDPRWLDARITDNGAGLPADGVDRIFEPDFTTKTRGTGLGLALVRQAVVNDGGRIDAHALEAGAAFTVRLPAVTVSGDSAAADRDDGHRDDDPNRETV